MSIIDNFLLNLPLPLIDHWGYLIIFLAAMAEGLPVIGSFFPGHTVVILGGFFVQLGVLRLDAAILAAVAGAFIGDLLGYTVGRRYGYDFISRYGKYFFFSQEKYQATRQMVNEHAGKTLIIGRFGAFTRAFAPLIAGLSRVKFFKFVFYGLAGSLVWGAASILFGYLFGQGFTAAAKYFGYIVSAAMVAIIAIVLGYRLLNKRWHIFVKHHFYYLIFNALSIYVFSKMAEDYLERESTYRLDLWLDQNVHLIWQPWLSQLMIFITNIFRPEVLLAAALAAATYFFIKRRWHQAALIFLSAGGGLALGALAKLLVNRPRPTGGLILETGLSFPSQHALMAVIFFSLVMYWLAKKIQRQWLKYLCLAAAAGLVALISFSRLYLKVHWTSDVVAGLALGLFWLTFLILAFRIVRQLAPADKKNRSE
ncbi:MAG: hypothetical protein AUK20_01930 [Parcubacteria group bacterium CG2_30_45_37]|nr:MAG: hypothetical protein AUK20_01930 [Parcubacteria group bacterium CG2_30_45_37]